MAAVTLAGQYGVWEDIGALSGLVEPTATPQPPRSEEVTPPPQVAFPSLTIPRDPKGVFMSKADVYNFQQYE